MIDRRLRLRKTADEFFFLLNLKFGTGKKSNQKCNLIMYILVGFSVNCQCVHMSL